MIKNSTWKPDWGIIPEADKDLFRSMSTVLSTPMERITKDRISGVSLLQRAATYYVKTYSGKKERFKQLIGVSRFDREVQNLDYFTKLGLRTPLVVAYGRETLLGFLRSGLLVTVEVDESTSLEELIESGRLYDRGVPYVRALLEQLALAVKQLHEDGFYHRDLKTRNILVQECGERCQLYFFDCPSGHHPLPWLLHRSIVRDLAHLERGLRGYVRKVDLIYFYKKYRGIDKLSAEDKRLARATLNYYGQRRMTPKRKIRAERRSLNRVN